MSSKLRTFSKSVLFLFLPGMLSILVEMSSSASSPPLFLILLHISWHTEELKQVWLLFSLHLPVYHWVPSWGANSALNWRAKTMRKWWFILSLSNVCSNRPKYHWQKLNLNFFFCNANTKRCSGKRGFVKVAFANSAVSHKSKSTTGFRGSWNCSQAPASSWVS